MDQFKLNLTKCAHCGEDLPAGKAKYCSSSCRNKAKLNRSVTPEKLERQVKMRRVSAQRARQVVHNKRYSLLMMLGCKCSLCGYSENISALHFHHRDPSEKSLSLNGITLATYAEHTVLAELDKCDILCANCHHSHHNPHLDLKNFNEENIVEFSRVTKAIPKKRCKICTIPLGRKGKDTCGPKCRSTFLKLKHKNSRKLLKLIKKKKTTKKLAIKLGITPHTLNKRLTFAGIQWDQVNCEWFHNEKADAHTKLIKQLKLDYPNSQLIQNYKL